MSSTVNNRLGDLSSPGNGTHNTKIRRGSLYALATKAEVDAQFRLLEAYIVAIPTKRASAILRLVDEDISQGDELDGGRPRHLRRLIKPDHLPSHLNAQRVVSGLPAHLQEHGCPKVLSEQSLDGRAPGSSGLRLEDMSNSPSLCQPLLYLLICPISRLGGAGWQVLLDKICESCDMEKPPMVVKSLVPASPPTSDLQAQEWSRQYWPTVYRKHNPFGAQPATFTRAADEMEESVSTYMNLAREVAQSASEASIGQAVGVVIVDRSQSTTPSVVLACSDARWYGCGSHNSCQGNGNVMAHAVMRAIGLVARKRREVSSEAEWEVSESNGEPFTDIPITDFEKAAYDRSSIQLGGYLCLDLEFYITHEPCVMCSMALVHSRVGRVVFEERMTRTGGLTAGSAYLDGANFQQRGEEGKGTAEHSTLGYGIFWRPSLNWKFLAWQWVEHGHEEPTSNEGDWHA